MDNPIEEPPKEENKKSTLFKILTPIFVVFFIFVLILVKRQNPDFPIGYVILIGIIIIVIGAAVFFSFDIFHRVQQIKDKEKNKIKLPEPAAIDVLWAAAMKALPNHIYRDHIKEYVGTINHSIGKNMKSLVVEFKVRTLYEYGKECSILINANYPKRLPTVLFDPDKFQLSKAIQSMSFDPEDPANEEETTLHNTMTGVTSRTKKKTFNRPTKDKLPAQKEALV